MKDLTKGVRQNMTLLVRCLRGMRKTKEMRKIGSEGVLPAKMMRSTWVKRIVTRLSTLKLTK